MHVLERRLQILLDEPRYRRLAARARERKVSIASVVRDAIDEALPADLAKKKAAWEAIKRADPVPVPAAVEELRGELDEAHARGP